MSPPRPCSVCGTPAPHRSRTDLAHAIGSALAIAEKQANPEGKAACLSMHLRLLQRELLGACISCSLADVAAGRVEEREKRIEEDYLNATDPARHTCLVIPFPSGPSQMTRDLLLPEPV